MISSHLTCFSVYIFQNSRTCKIITILKLCILVMFFVCLPFEMLTKKLSSMASGPGVVNEHETERK